MKRFCLGDEFGCPESPTVCRFGITEVIGAALGIGSAAAGAGAAGAGLAAAGAGAVGAADAGLGLGAIGAGLGAAGAGALGAADVGGGFLGDIGDALGGAASWVGNELGIGGGSMGASEANAAYGAGTMGMGPTAIGSSSGLGSLGPATSGSNGLFGTGIGAIGGPVGTAGGISGTAQSLGLISSIAQMFNNNKKPNYGVTPGPSTTAATAGPYFNAMPNTGYINRTLQPITPASGNWSTYGETGEPQFYSNNQISGLTGAPPGSARGGRIGNKKGYALGGVTTGGGAPGATDYAPVTAPQQQFGGQPMPPWQRGNIPQMTQPQPQTGGAWGQRPIMQSPGPVQFGGGMPPPGTAMPGAQPGMPQGVAPPMMSGLSPGWQPPQGGAMGMARGGMLHHLATGGRGVFETERGDHYVQGHGSGKDDTVNAKLAPDEFVFDASSVSRLGNGSSREGARRLEMIRKAIHSDTKSKGVISRKAKSPLEYLKEARR